MNHVKVTRTIEAERNGCVCVACGAHYPSYPSMLHALPVVGCSREAPHYKVAVEWVRAFQAGPLWRELIPVTVLDTLTENAETVMGIELPRVDHSHNGGARP